MILDEKLDDFGCLEFGISFDSEIFWIYVAFVGVSVDFYQGSPSLHQSLRARHGGCGLNVFTTWLVSFHSFQWEAFWCLFMVIDVHFFRYSIGLPWSSIFSWVVSTFLSSLKQCWARLMQISLDDYIISRICFESHLHQKQSTEQLRGHHPGCQSDCWVLHIFFYSWHIMAVHMTYQCWCLQLQGMSATEDPVSVAWWNDLSSSRIPQRTESMTHRFVQSFL